MSGKSGRRSPRSQREMYRKIHGCAMELLAKLGHSYVISALSREPLFSISEDREVVCKEGEPPRLFLFVKCQSILRTCFVDYAGTTRVAKL